MTSIYSGMMRDKLTRIMLKSDSVNDIIKSSKSYSERGFIVEAISDILIRFGMVDIFPRSTCQYKTGNMNTASLHNMQSLETYLTNTKVISGNSGGASDITLYNSSNEKHIFISSKYPKDGDEKAKSVDYYGIDGIISSAADHSESYQNYEVYLIVPNKQVVLDAVKRANKSSKYITKFMTEDHILDNTDLERYFKQFKREVSRVQFDQYDIMFGSKRENLQLRFHQRIVVLKTRKLVAAGETKILWGHKCRSGKTYMAGAIITDLKYDLKGLNVMVITPAPSETLPQFKQDLFERFNDFKCFNIVQLTGKNASSLVLGENNIIIASKQLLQRYVGDSKIKSICKLKLDLIIYDENHFGGTTDCSKEIVASYATPKTVQIYMTATFRKPRVEWGIKPTCELMWDLEDEQLCKARDVKALIDRHGSIAKRLLCDKRTTEDLLKVYDQMPDLHMITNMFQPERYAKIRELINDNSPYGISFDTLLELNKKKQCANSAEVSMYLRYISGSDEEADFPQPKKGTSIFRSMRNTCKKYGSRPVFTQLWFLPPNNIDDTSNALKRVMLEDRVLKKYEIICINSKSKLCADVKTTIDVHYKIALRDNKRGLIILAGGMLSLGITIPHCDAVFLLNNTISSDKVYQQMYRSMSEADGKSVGFVVDMNIGRVLNTCVTYNVRGQKLNTEDQIRYVIDHNLMILDDDYFGTRERDVEKVVSTLMEYWRSDPINSFKTLLMNLENEVITLSSSDQSMINQRLLVSKSGKSVAIKIEQDEDAQETPTGKTRGDPIENSHESSDSDSDSSDEEEVLPEISVSRDLLPFLVPLLCLLTLNDSNSDIGSMLHRIKTTPTLLAVFEDQSFVWWNRKGLVELFEKLAARYIDRNGVANNVSLIIKMELKSLLDEPIKLLEFIESCLKPKETEKKRFGEVFTPMKLVNEMLDKLP
jgi:hypothetical protein